MIDFKNFLVDELSTRPSFLLPSRCFDHFFLTSYFPSFPLPSFSKLFRFVSVFVLERRRWRDEVVDFHRSNRVGRCTFFRVLICLLARLIRLRELGSRWERVVLVLESVIRFLDGINNITPAVSSQRLINSSRARESISLYTFKTSMEI